MLLDATGGIQSLYTYDAWGNPLIPNDDPNPFRWNGKFGYTYIPLTGLYHVGAREYDPRTARWLQRDPIHAASGDPNVYRYCGNDPVNRVDPDGLDWLLKASDFAAGWGDALTFGGTGLIRNWLGVNDIVDQNSPAYAAGSIAGAANGLGLSAPAAVRAGQGIKGLYNVWQAGRGGLNIGGQNCSRLYIYTSEQTAELVKTAKKFGRGPNPTVHLTPNANLTPLQAQLELALPPHNTGMVVFEVPVSLLNKNLIGLVRRVTGNINNKPGGGWEVVYQGTIPWKGVRKLR